MVMLLMGLALWACGAGDVPEGVLGKQKMATILTDIFLAETEFSRLDLRRDTIMMLFEEYEQFIYEKSGTTEEQYKKSLIYYYDQPKKLDNIYESVLDSLIVMESRAKAMEEAARKNRNAQKEASP